MLGVVRGHQQVGAERHVGPAGDAEAVHLAEHRLLGVEQAHEAADVPPHHLEVDDRVPGPVRVVVRGHDRRINAASQCRPRPRFASGRDRVRATAPTICPFRRCDEVVAAAEPGPVPGERDRVHLRVEVGALDARRQLARHLERDAVSPLGPIERDSRDAPVAGVGHRLELQGHDAIRPVARRRPTREPPASRGRSRTRPPTRGRATASRRGWR